MTIAEKWNRIYQDANDKSPPASRVLLENQHLLPATGDALDLACGLGGNALLLAEHGLNTEAWDISEIAISNLEHTANERNLPLTSLVRDVSATSPAADSYDVIVVSRFLERKLMPTLATSLRINGLVYYQTFTREKTSKRGPKNPDFLLTSNELLDYFGHMKLLVYREEGLVGNTELGFRDEAMLVAMKTAHD